MSIVFGNGILFALLIFIAIIILLAIFRVPAGGIVAILVPLSMAFAVAGRATGLIELPLWVYLIIIMIGGIIFAVTIFFAFMR